MMADLNAIEGIPFSRAKFGRVLKQLLADSSLGLVPLFIVKREIVGYAVVTYNFDLEWGGRDACNAPPESSHLFELLSAELFRAQVAE